MTVRESTSDRSPRIDHCRCRPLLLVRPERPPSPVNFVVSFPVVLAPFYPTYKVTTTTTKNKVQDSSSVFQPTTHSSQQCKTFQKMASKTSAKTSDECRARNVQNSRGQVQIKFPFAPWILTLIYTLTQAQRLGRLHFSPMLVDTSAPFSCFGI
ncbi:uncharacterized protein [Bemisia tabaci]|uniref:uncharacterized protein isoform X2 n=1 Tax=Bemisia tabaci TaxID=7038 RepID=UPI003B28B99C